MELVTVLLIIGVLILNVLLYLRRKYTLWKNLNAPYIQPKFPYGNLKGVGKKEHFRDRLQTFYNEYRGKVPFIGIYFFTRPVALLLDLELIKQILIKDFNNFNDRAAYFNEKDDPVSAHLFAIHGPKWKTLRTKLTPTFTTGKMKFMFSTVAEVGSRLEEKLSKLTKLQDVEIKDVLARYTTDVIGSCAFGIECNTLNNKNADFRRIGLRIFDDPKHSFFTSIFLSSFPKLAQKVGIKAVRTDVSSFLSNVIRETINYRKTNKVHRNDFLDILIELKAATESSENPLTLNEIYAQSFVFFAAGFETSSTLLTFCLYELALNPDIQNKTREHIEEVLKKHNGELTYEAMMDMKYVDQVLNETLRLFPPISTLIRNVEKDYKVPGTDYIFKRDTLTAIPIYAIHRDAKYYPNPEMFNPENFSEENMRNRSTMTFLPFGEGPRNCIGLRFGMMQARLGLISALRKFHYKLSSKTEDPVKLEPNRFITSPRGGLWLTVEQIKP